MKNIRKIFEKNSLNTYKLQIKNQKVIFDNNDGIFSESTLIKIINFVNTVHTKYNNMKIPLVFSLNHNKICIKDKLSYILFECICYSLIKDFNHKIYLYMKPDTSNHTKGIYSSPLRCLNGEKESFDLFVNQFKIDISQTHFRKLMNGEEKKNTNYLGNLFEDINNYLKYYSVSKSYRDAISEMIAELVGNACEHGNTDCLLDIDIVEDFDYSKSSNYVINIVIINFSDKLLGNGVKEKIENNQLGTDRYIRLGDAYNYHKTQFSENYSYVDFCNISSLQDKISGRQTYNLAGGAGLTKLIEILREYVHIGIPYMQSGNRITSFYKNLLNYDNDDWIGFNEENNFMKSLPDKKIFSNSSIFLPGTAFNLSFVMEREE